MHNLRELDIEIREDFQSFTAEIPEIPGCSASGFTATEAIENLKFALQELGFNCA
jgi:predicted RNase H-like HicB family nuclease